MTTAVALAIIAALLIYALAGLWAADREDQRAHDAAAAAATRKHARDMAALARGGVE